MKKLAVAFCLYLLPSAIAQTPAPPPPIPGAGHAVIQYEGPGACMGCANTTLVGSGWAPGLTRGDQDLPTGPDHRWAYEPTTGAWAFIPGGSFWKSVTATVGKDGGEVGVGTAGPSSVLLTFTNLQLRREAGKCIGTQPACAVHQGCETFFTGNVKMVAHPEGGDVVEFHVNDKWTFELLYSSPTETQFTCVEKDECTGSDKELYVEVDYYGTFTQPDLFSVEWRCKKCPWAGL